MPRASESRPRFAGWLLAALALHAVAMVAARIPTTVLGSEAPRAPFEFEPTEISLVDERPIPSVRTETQAIAAAESLSQAHRRDVAPGPWVAPGPEALRSTTPGGEQEEGYSANPANPANPSAEEPRSGIDLGIGSGSWTKWGAFTAPLHDSPGGDSRPRNPAPVSSTGGLLEALELHDREVGLGAAGAVMAAIREAMTGQEAPRYGTAQFAVTVYLGGDVEVAVGASSGESSWWNETSKRIASLLRKKPPKVGAQRRGVRCVIEVVAQEQLPAGDPKQTEPLRQTTTPPKLQSTEEAKTDLAQRNPAAAPAPAAPAEQRPTAPITDAPGVYVGGRGRLGDIKVGLGTYGEPGGTDPGKSIVSGLVMKGNIDLANIVGRSSRVVSMRVIRENAF
jgi:hypothetical protein